MGDQPAPIRARVAALIKTIVATSNSRTGRTAEMSAKIADIKAQYEEPRQRLVLGAAELRSWLRYIMQPYSVVLPSYSSVDFSASSFVSK